jgi:D-psicose/D-tagatose/L-ribulose 3-epimerase
MRFGICYSPDQASALAEVGYDFVEWPMNRTVGDASDKAYTSLSKLTRDLPIAPEAWNMMLPGSIKVVGPDADHTRLKQYVETALTRAAELGGQIVVFGSGGSRTVPDGWSMEEGKRQFDDACRIVGDVAARHGIIIAIEPLNRTETNLINTASEAATVVERLAHPCIRLLSDLSHVRLNGEALSDTGAAATKLAHVHVAHPYLRTMPRADEMDTVYKEYFKILRRSGYTNRVSIECTPPWPTVEEAAEGLRYLRDVWANIEAGTSA